MPVIDCPMEGCTYATPDVEGSVAASLLIVHNNVHLNETARISKQKPPKIDRPEISKESSEESWNTFLAKWAMFKDGTELSNKETLRQLFQCCDEELGEAILKGHSDVLKSSEEDLLQMMKQLAVIPVSKVVRRSDFISTKQDLGESTRSYATRLKGKAATCSYSCICPKDGCDQVVDFTDVIVKDVLVTGLVDDDIRRETLGWAELDTKDINETVQHIEAKEMARDAMIKPPLTNAAVSSYKSDKAKKPTGKISCDNCKAETDKFVWSRYKRKFIECTTCMKCWKALKKNSSRGPGSSKGATDEASALMIGAVSSVSHTDDVSSLTAGSNPPRTELCLDHYIFDSYSGWKKSDSLQHPTIRLRAEIDRNAYSQIGVKAPAQHSAIVEAVSDTGAQSCLWGLSDYLLKGFRKCDLLPVKRTLLAANQEQIDIVGALFMELKGKDTSGKVHSTHVMVYISPCTTKFYLSRNALMQLGVISEKFPCVGSVGELSVVSTTTETVCDCKPRTLPPERPSTLPFECKPENNLKMKEWLLDRYSSSTFNKCTHQILPSMTGPPLKIHVDPNAVPIAVSTPATVPRHWEKEVKESLDKDTRLGVCEKVPMGEPQTWVHRMVLVVKADGTLRRAVDLSPLNKHCIRETHHVKPPFLQARQIPARTWKTVTDAWNGFHSVPLREEDQHLTTFLTPWGRYRYKVAPQGFVASGDAYTRRYDEIMVDVPRKTKCVDDTALWDDELHDHWWRIIDYLELMGNNGVILNPEKFQFAEREITFAGFRISDTEIKPHSKFLKAIEDFPTPSGITDVRSWFGLVHQLSHYDQLSTIMAPFKPLLSPRTKFYWNDDLEQAFQRSKAGIVKAINKGVEIFDLGKSTCLQPDWSQTGIGFFLSQKHCACDSKLPGCCSDGWRIVMAGSRFLKPSESRYAAVEGEALAIAWALEQSRYFTQGCKNLLILTDHKPLVKLFGDRTLDEISNPRLFRLKQRTLLWRFSIHHKPGRLNFAPDAMSRHPVDMDNTEIDDIENSEILAGIRLVDDECLVAGNRVGYNVRAVTLDRVRAETKNDEDMLKLISFVDNGFPDDKSDLIPELQPYWAIRDQLFVESGVVMRKDVWSVPEQYGNEGLVSTHHIESCRVIVPFTLRDECLQVLHAAHQGVASMNECAKSRIYWPGITRDIAQIRASCSSCNLIAPSNAKLPPIEPIIPQSPFESIVCDFFFYKGWYYFVAGDRLSGWTEQQKVKVGSSDSGANGLCGALRKLFVTFGVPLELSSDGGPEFSAKLTQDFLQRWGVRHRMSSAYLASSNGRAELAVKSTKRLLMDNVGPNGELNNDKMVRALLTQRNTPDPGCKLSPAQILLGRSLRDSLPYVRKNVMSFNNDQISDVWRDSWRRKEDALRVRYVKTLENLSEHSRPLPGLNCGDKVLIQNQTGRFPTKWGKSGTVVEVKNNHQYVIKVDGSGRLTLRNRRFLRKYQHPGRCDLPVPVPNSSVQTLVRSPESAAQQKLTVDESEGDSVLFDNPEVLPQTDLDTGDNESSGQLKNKHLLSRLVSYNNPGLKEVVADSEVTNGVENEHGDGPRRSSRSAVSRKFYDAAAGTYKSWNG